MKKIVVIISILLQFQFGFAQDMVITQEGKAIQSIILNQEVKYSIILPKDYSKSEKSYPVVYLLHGLGGNHYSWLEYGRLSQYVEKAVYNGDIQEMIYVMPEGYSTYYINDFYGKFPYQDMFIKELVPYIDTNYRTLPNNKKRATIGFSMGGFGALILPLKHPDVFSVAVPLSISVRTDDQYMTETASEWDDQWGRLFGGVGLFGEARITPYYKNNSPFHLFNRTNLNNYKDLKIFIDNGDDEGTLSKSNEALHILLRDLNFKHEFRVRNGGHTFEYWRASLINGLNFIDDAFNEKPYRGDKNIDALENTIIESSNSIVIKDDSFEVLLPKDYETSRRYYPVIYFTGKFNQDTKTEITSQIAWQIKMGKFPPSISMFIDLDSNLDLDTVIKEAKEKYRIREGRRFQSIIGFKEAGAIALENAIRTANFTSCVVFDAPIDTETLNNQSDAQIEELKRNWFFISTTDKSKNYKSNGLAHIIMKAKNIYHEYRVDQGESTISWFLKELPNTLDFTQKKLHY